MATTLPKEISKVPLTFRPRTSRDFSKGTWKQCSHVGVQRIALCPYLDPVLLKVSFKPSIQA